MRRNAVPSNHRPLVHAVVRAPAGAAAASSSASAHGAPSVESLFRCIDTPALIYERGPSEDPLRSVRLGFSFTHAAAFSLAAVRDPIFTSWPRAMKPRPSAAATSPVPRMPTRIDLSLPG